MESPWHEFSFSHQNSQMMKKHKESTEGHPKKKKRKKQNKGLTLN